MELSPIMDIYTLISTRRILTLYIVVEALLHQQAATYVGTVKVADNSKIHT